MEDIYQAIILIVIGFLAGVINTLAGGGSLFTLPVLIFLGLPPNIANGTNRIAIVMQSLTGTLGYKSKGVSSFPFNIYLGISASIGALIGAQVAIDLDGKLFNKILFSNVFIFIFTSLCNLISLSPSQIPEARCIIPNL